MISKIRSKTSQSYRAIQKVPGNQPHAKPIDRFNIYDYYVVRPLSFLPAILLHRLGVSPNTVTYCGFLVGVAANILFLLPQNQTYLLAAILINAFHLLDYVDGSMARLRKWPNYYGKFIDAMNDTTTYTLLCVATGMAGYHTTGSVVYVFLGSLSACLILWDRMMRARFLEYSAAVQSARAAEPQADRENLRPHRPGQATERIALVSLYVRGIAFVYRRGDRLFRRAEPRYRENLGIVRVLGLLAFAVVDQLHVYVVVMLVVYSVVAIPSILLTLLEARHTLRVYRP